MKKSIGCLSVFIIIIFILTIIPMLTDIFDKGFDGKYIAWVPGTKMKKALVYEIYNDNTFYYHDDVIYFSIEGKWKKISDNSIMLYYSNGQKEKITFDGSSFLIDGIKFNKY